MDDADRPHVGGGAEPHNGKARDRRFNDCLDRAVPAHQSDVEASGDDHGDLANSGVDDDLDVPVVELRSGQVNGHGPHARVDLGDAAHLPAAVEANLAHRGEDLERLLAPARRGRELDGRRQAADHRGELALCLGPKDLFEGRSAIEDRGNLLALHYQPIIDLTTGATIGTEALTYIRRPEGMMLGPGEFIPIAEDSGLIVPLGAAVLDLACAQQARWCAVKASQDHVAVNVSGRQLSRSEFVDSIVDALGTHSLRPDNLCIELTESSLIDTGPNVLAQLYDLKAIGVKLALDDFGTGWSSLSHLRRFHIDIVKIDRSVVSGLGTKADDSELVKAVVDLARALDITTIAEGVETTTQDGLLRGMGCAQAQGFLYGRPQTAA